MLWRILLSVYLLVCTSGAEDEVQKERIVRISQGRVRGYKASDGDYFVFYNIPYATVPTGPYRFKEPLPAPTWQHTFEAVDKSVVCPQGYMPFGGLPDITKMSMQEDCLIANIYVPDTEETNLPVVVYVHGGAYQVGYGDMMPPTSFVKSKKVIAVNFNYRLGVHGFLCLGTKDVPGNAGMKDQVALLRWVKKNIASFGGNPDDVTLSGYSAGSSAVDLLMISKTTKDLFNKVIPESGANVASWSVQINPVENAKTFANTLNFTNTDNIHALEEFYKTASFELLCSDTFLDRLNSNFLFTPCIERETGVERFLEDSPVNILKSGKYTKVPILYGFANMEGLFRLPQFESWKDKMNQKFSDFLPVDLEFKNDKEKEDVAKLVKEFYFGDKPVNEETVLGYIDYFTDVIFAYPTLRSTKLQVEAGNNEIYLYEFSYVNDYIQSLLPTGNITVRGANHCAQTAITLDLIKMFNVTEEQFPEDFKEMRDIMTELWLNFILTGKPSSSLVPEWRAVGADWAPHMALDSPPQLKGSLLQRRALFWEDIYERYYRNPTPPSIPSTVHAEL